MATKRPYTGDSGGQPPAKKQSLAPSTSFADVLKAMPTQGNTIDDYNATLSELTSNDRQLDFQVIDICYEEQTTLIKIFGCTSEGQPVVADITDFKPYFHISAPHGFEEHDREPFVDYIIGWFEENMVYDVELVGAGPGGDGSTTLKIYHKPEALTQLQEFFRSGTCAFKGLFRSPPVLYKAADNFVDLFMFEKRLSCLGSWVTIGAEQYKLMDVNDPRKTIHIQVCKDEIEVDVAGAIRMAPLRMLSGDIETAVRGNEFPHPTQDSVFQISCMLSVYGQPEPFYRVVFALKGCAPIAGTVVKSFKTEEQLLSEWRAFFHKVNPDVVIGHNSARFDWPYLLKRAETLRVPQFELARIQASPSSRLEYNTSEWGTSAPAHGRVNLDTMHCIYYDSTQKRSYRLGDVGEEVLKEKKEDVKFTEIVKLQDGTPEDRRRMAIYCCKDTWLALRISQELKHLEKLAKLSSQQLVTLNSLFKRFDRPGKGARFNNAAKEGFMVGRLMRA